MAKKASTKLPPPAALREGPGRMRGAPVSPPGERRPEGAERGETYRGNPFFLPVCRPSPAYCAPRLLFVLPKRRRSAPGPEEKGAACGQRCDRRQAICPQLSDRRTCPKRVSDGLLAERNMPNQVTQCKSLPPAPCSAKRNGSARKQRRQPFPRLHPVLRKSPDIRGDQLNDCRRETRVQAPFSLWAESAAAACGR